VGPSCQSRDQEKKKKKKKNLTVAVWKAKKSLVGASGREPYSQTLNTEGIADLFSSGDGLAGAMNVEQEKKKTTYGKEAQTISHHKSEDEKLERDHENKRGGERLTRGKSDQQKEGKDACRARNDKVLTGVVPRLSNDRHAGKSTCEEGGKGPGMVSDVQRRRRHGGHL